MHMIHVTFQPFHGRPCVDEFESREEALRTLYQLWCEAHKPFVEYVDQFTTPDEDAALARLSGDDEQTSKARWEIFDLVEHRVMNDVGMLCQLLEAAGIYRSVKAVDESEWRDRMTYEEALDEEALLEDLRYGDEPELAARQLRELRERVVTRMLA
jgi:hypothetical protein